MKIKFLLLLAIMLVLSGPTMRPQAADPNLRVSFDPIDTVVVRLGQRAPVEFTFHIKQGFHINSNQPTTPELIPTALAFSPPEDLVIAKVTYPAGVLTRFPFDPDSKLSVYSGDVIVKAVVLTAPHAAAGVNTVHGELKYQACDNSACYPPKKLPISFNVKITNGASTKKARPNAQSPHIHN